MNKRWIVCGMIAVAVSLAGCKAKTDEVASGGEDMAKADSQPAQTQPAEEDAPGGTDLLIKNPTSRRVEEEGYKVNENIASGRLVGACRWAGKPDRLRIPPPAEVELTGERGIKNPDKGEVEYYQNIKIKQPQYVYQGYNLPSGAVVMVRGIKEGRRDMIERATYLVRQGVYTPQVQFAPVKERVMFGTYDSYPTNVLVKSLAGGKVFMDKEISAFDRDTIKPLGGGGLHFTAQPKMIQSEVLPELGGYEISCKRHPWKQAWVFTLDSPYAVVVGNEGKFAIEAIPVGKWTVEVWHPQLRLVQKTYQIEIKKDETSELAVMFELPDGLKAPAEEKK